MAVAGDGSTVIAGAPYATVGANAQQGASYVFTGAASSYALTVSKAGSGGGTVASDIGGISCGSSCQAAYGAGQTVTLTATPDSESVFAGWSGAGCTGTGVCTVTMSADQAVTARFDPAPPVFLRLDAACYAETYSATPPVTDKALNTLPVGDYCASATMSLGYFSDSIGHSMAAAVQNEAQFDAVFYFAGHAACNIPETAPGVFGGFLNIPAADPTGLADTSFLGGTDGEACLSGFTTPIADIERGLPPQLATSTLVVLQSCFSALSPDSGEPAGHVDIGRQIWNAGARTVVGFQHLVFYGDPTAGILGQAWAEGFWTAIAQGQPIDTAVQLGSDFESLSDPDPTGTHGYGSWEITILGSTGRSQTHR